MEEVNIKINVDTSEIDGAIKKLETLDKVVTTSNLRSVPYICPICLGEGMTNPWVSTTSTAKETCRACGGTGIIWG